MDITKMSEFIRDKVVESNDSNSWVGTRVRKSNRYGTVISDLNLHYRTLEVRMDEGGKTEKIVMNNRGPDPIEAKDWEWQTKDPHNPDKMIWYRF